MVRAGIALYGLYPSEEVKKQAVKLRPALELKFSYQNDFIIFFYIWDFRNIYHKLIHTDSAPDGNSLSSY